MKSGEENNNDLRDYLLKQFRSGDKWLAYNPFANELTKNDVVSFRTLDETSLHCESTFMAFKSLAAAIREIRGERRHAIIHSDKLKEEVARYPVESYMQGRDLANDLASGEIHPVIFNKTINPAFDIPNYYLIEHKHPGHQVYEIGHEVFILEIFDSFSQAKDAFSDKIRHNSNLPDIIKPDLILVAGLMNQKLQLDMEGLPESNSGILLTTAYPLYQADQQIKLYEVNHWQPPECPVLKQPMLAQFNPRNSRLNFYDGHLQKVQAGASIEFVKIDFYDFQPLKVGNVQKHSIDEEVKQHPQKMRHKLT